MTRVTQGGCGAAPPHGVPLGEEDLAGRRFAAQPGGEDDRVADAAIVVAALEADPAHRRVARRDPDADLENVAPTAPLLTTQPGVVPPVQDRPFTDAEMPALLAYLRKI